MKTLLVAIIVFISIVNISGQDTTKVRVDFQIKSNSSIPLLRQIYVGNVSTSGWVGQHYSYQEGIITKNEFLFNAPNTGYFKKDEPIVIIMPNNFSFVVDPLNGNQKWLLTPAGEDYNKSIKQKFIGGAGIYVSTLSLLTVIIYNIVRREFYNMDMTNYNDVKKMNMNPGPVPQEPHNGALYLIPAITYSISIPIFISGKHLYAKNRPKAERIE